MSIYFYLSVAWFVHVYHSHVFLVWKIRKRKSTQYKDIWLRFTSQVSFVRHSVAQIEWILIILVLVIKQWNILSKRMANIERWNGYWWCRVWIVTVTLSRWHGGIVCGCTLIKGLEMGIIVSLDMMRFSKLHVTARKVTWEWSLFGVDSFVGH